MTALGWIVYSGVIASVVIVLGLLLWTLQDCMSHEMAGEFDHAYDPMRHQSDNLTDARSELNPRQEPGNMLDIRPLPTAARTRFADDWQSLQPRFVIDPDDAVKEADRLASDVMRTRGYPMGEFAQRAADISVEHPDVVSHYREAHRLAQRAADGQATTEEERRALAEYRELFDELLRDARPDVSPAQSISQTG